LGFIHTLMDLAGEKRLPPQFLSGIVFRDGLKTFLPEDWEQFTAAEQEEIFYDFVVGLSDLMEATTPEDLAATPELEWVYVIRRGKVYTGNSTSRSANCSPGNPARNVSAEGGARMPLAFTFSWQGSPARGGLASALAPAHCVHGASTSKCTPIWPEDAPTP
jgi:hypothetical protein